MSQNNYIVNDKLKIQILLCASPGQKRVKKKKEFIDNSNDGKIHTISLHEMTPKFHLVYK